MKEPLVGVDMQSVDSARESIELFVVNVSEYRNTTERGSHISRGSLGRLPLGAHGVRLLRDTLEPGQEVHAAGQFQRDVHVGGFRNSLRILLSALTGIPFAH